MGYNAIRLIGTIALSLLTTQRQLHLFGENAAFASQYLVEYQARCASEEEGNRLRAYIDHLVTEGSPEQQQQISALKEQAEWFRSQGSATHAARISQLEQRAERLERFGSAEQVLRIRRLEAQLLQAQSQNGAAQAQRILELEGEVLRDRKSVV